MTHIFRTNQFSDGNGRVGRILSNFILVAHGLPNIAIKGLEKDRAKYITALEEADSLVYKVLRGRLSWGKVFTQTQPFVSLEEIINKNLADSLDIVICGLFEKSKKTLKHIDEVAKQTNKNLDSFRVACSQKKIICTRRGRHLVTHRDLLSTPL